MLIFYDFEVFRHNWLVCINCPSIRQEYVFIDDKEALEQFHVRSINDIWVGFNSKHYDQYILKGILCGFNPWEINDHIIRRQEPGWNFSSLLRKIKLSNYDVMRNIDRGLKVFEAFMGADIQESPVPWNLNRSLTPQEIQEVVKYCKRDVAQTMEIFLRREDDYHTHMDLVAMAHEVTGWGTGYLVSKTNPQLTAIILGARRAEHDDEFEIFVPKTIKIQKYKHVVDWYTSQKFTSYYEQVRGKSGKMLTRKKQLETPVAGVPHKFGFGGIHGAPDGAYRQTGFFLHLDTSSLYPSLIIQYGLNSRGVSNPKKYEEIFKKRFELKALGDKREETLKLILNSAYGAMKEPGNDLYDPRQGNLVCVFGQLLTLDLIEQLEPIVQLVQSNTDGLIIRMPPAYAKNQWYDMVDDICYEWEKRTRLKLGKFTEYVEVWQKDVNNYVLIDKKQEVKSIGAWTKELSELDNDLPVVNRALIEYMSKRTPIEDTIFGAHMLVDFQFVTKLSSLYSHFLHGEERLKERTLRLFASVRPGDGGLRKVHAVTGRAEKVSNSPLRCFLNCRDIRGVEAPEYLNRQWYVELARKRLKEFGG